MKQFKIDPKVEKEVEAMFVLASQIRSIKEKYPACWEIIGREFKLVDAYRYKDRPELDAETVKLDLYVEVHKANEKEALEKKAKLKEKLSNNK